MNLKVFRVTQNEIPKLAKNIHNYLQDVALFFRTPHKRDRNLWGPQNGARAEPDATYGSKINWHTSSRECGNMGNIEKGQVRNWRHFSGRTDPRGNSAK